MRDNHVYRAFRLNKQGHVVGAEHIIADDDDQALEKLRDLAAGDGIELWDRARKVCFVAPIAMSALAEMHQPKLTDGSPSNAT